MPVQVDSSSLLNAAWTGINPTNNASGPLLHGHGRVPDQAKVILAREDDDSISLALDWYPQQKLWRRIQHIPKPYIFELRKITV